MSGRRVASVLPRHCGGLHGTPAQHLEAPDPYTEGGYDNDWLRLARQILERDYFKCNYCGGRADTVDHVLAKASGGTDHPANLVAACRRCNGRKGAR